MARRKQLKISLSNKMLRGWKNKGIESKFKELGEKGLAIYFLILRRMNGENLTWITVNQILNSTGLQRRDKKEVIRVLNFLDDEKLIFLEQKIEDVGNNDELEIYIETDLSEESYTAFYPNNFKFYEMVGTKGFTLFCMIEAFIGTNESAYCSIETLVELTGFNKNTVLEHIYILGEIGIFDIAYGAYNVELKRNTTNTYYKDNLGRIELLTKTVDEVKEEVKEFKEEYEERKTKRAERIKQGIKKKEEKEDLEESSKDVLPDNVTVFPKRKSGFTRNTVNEELEGDGYSIPF